MLIRKIGVGNEKFVIEIWDSDYFVMCHMNFKQQCPEDTINKMLRDFNRLW